jgi:hypothetical protein
LHPQTTRIAGTVIDGYVDKTFYSDESGMTIRDVMATQLLAGILADSNASGDLVKDAVCLADELIEELNIEYRKDGNMWCATRPGFINLQESTAGFGKTKREANADLKRNERVQA